MSQQAQLFPDAPAEANLTVSEWDYFGRSLDGIAAGSRENYGLLPEQGDLHRHSYLYHVDYPVSTRGDGSEVGAIELRARTWTYSADLSDTFRTVLKACAHRAAQLFDTSIQTAAYSGYLTGFNVINPGSSWESEKVAGSGGSQAQPGKIDWNVEIYDKEKNLSGVAQGIANPWRLTEDEVPGKEPIHVAPHKWNLTFNESRESYDVHPAPNTQARERFQPGGAAHDKEVHINGKPIGKLDREGRTWLKKQYQAGDTYRGQWSREGIISETEATPQAIRAGGTLYHVGETQNHIYLRTSRALPPDYETADPDSVSPTMDVEPGLEGYTRYVLSLRSNDAGTPVECRRDERVIRHLGESLPKYRHVIQSGWRGP